MSWLCQFEKGNLEMDIINALMTENICISCGRKHLYFDEITKEWIVMLHEYKARHSIEQCRTTDQNIAVSVLLN